MALSWRIDQGGGGGNGTTNTSREDLWESIAITLRDLGSAPSGTTWLWTLNDQPPDAAATLSNATTATATLSGATRGTYKITYTKNGETAVFVFRVTKDATGTDIDDLLILPAADERDEHLHGIAKGWHLLFWRMVLVLRAQLQIGSDEVSIASTPTLSATLTSLIAAGRRRFRLVGDSTLEAPLSLPSDCELDLGGHDVTIGFAGTGVPLVGGVLDPTNAAVRIRGVADTATMDTTLTSTATGANYVPIGSPVLTVTTRGTIAAGWWIRVGGHIDQNFGGYWNGQTGQYVSFRSIYKIDTVTALGGTEGKLTLKSDTNVHHTLTNGGVGDPQVVQAITPVERVTIRNGSFRSPGGTVACAVYCELADSVHLENVGFEGFTLAPVWVEETRHVTLVNPHSYGECNSFVAGRNAHEVTIFNPTTDPNGKRYHAQGRIFGQFLTLPICCDWSIFGGRIEHVCLGLQVWGAYNLLVDGLRIRDTLVDELLVRDSTIYGSGAGSALDQGTYSHAPQMGTAIDQASVALVTNIYNLGCTYANVFAEDCRAGTGLAANDESATIWWHDSKRETWTGLQVINTGRSPSATIDGDVKGMNGIRVQDVEGMMLGVTVTGCEWGLRHNSSQGARFQRVHLSVIDGAGALASIALSFGQVTPSSATFRDIYTVGQIHFEGSWNGADADYIDCANWNVDGQFFDGPLYPMKNLTGATRGPGEVVALDAAAGATRQTTNTTPANADPKWMVVVDDAFGTPNGAWGFGSRGPRTYVQVAAATAIGDALQAQGGSYKAEVTTTPTVRSFMGVAETRTTGAGTVAVAR